jgi:hypothetical protein
LVCSGTLPSSEIQQRTGWIIASVTLINSFKFRRSIPVERTVGNLNSQKLERLNLFRAWALWLFISTIRLISARKRPGSPPQFQQARNLPCQKISLCRVVTRKRNQFSLEPFFSTFGILSSHPDVLSVYFDLYGQLRLSDLQVKTELFDASDLKPMHDFSISSSHRIPFRRAHMSSNQTASQPKAGITIGIWLIWLMWLSCWPLHF